MNFPRFDPREDKGGSNIGLAGCGKGIKIEAGCGIQRKLEAGCRMKSSSPDRDTQFFTVGMRDVFEIDGGKEDHKNNFMTEKTPNNLIMIIYMKGIITCVFRFTGDIYNHCVHVLDPLTPPLRELWLGARVCQRSHNFSHYSLK